MVSQGKKVTIPEFISVAASLMKSGAHNLQILSPTVHFPALRIALRELRRIGFPLPIIFKSSGYERVEELRTFEGLVDIFLPDLKFGSNSSLAGVAGVADYFKVTTAAIEEMIRQTGPLLLDNEGIGTRGVLIRHVRAPIYKDEWAALSTYLDRLPKGVVVSINKNFVNLTPLPDERGNR
jgi:putative pyruvate formate lyase activating enzyme